jgi:hypothetical protein
LSSLLIVWGIVILGYSIKWGAAEGYHDLFGETGIDMELVTDELDKLISQLALWFLGVGLILLFLGLFGYLTLHCRKCLCTSTYGFCLTIFSTLIAVYAIVLLFAMSISD